MNYSVSIIMPTYNYGSFLRECVESVFAQTFQEFEILIIDDGSTDDTPHILKGFSDHRLHVVRTPNRGVSSARNIGLDLAKGNLIAFLDADDRWLPHKLEAQVAAFNEDPEIGFVFTNFVRFKVDGSVLTDQFSFAPELENLPATQIAGTDAYKIDGNALTTLLTLSDMPWYPTANMVKASLAKSEKFPVHRKIAEDVDYFLRIWRKTQSAFIPRVCAELRRHEKNASATLEVPYNLIMLDVLNDITNLSLSNEQAHAVQKRKGREWASLGYRYWQNGQYVRAATTYIQAIRYPGRRINALKHLLAIPIALVMKTFK